MCWGQYFGQSSSTMYFHWASSPQLKSSVWSPPVLQGWVHMKMQCSTAKHGPPACVLLWSCRCLGQCRCSSCSSPSESNLTGPFLAREGTAPSSPPVCLFQAQHASRQLLQEEWELGLVTLLFGVVVAALSLYGTRASPTCVSRPGLC